MSTSPARTLPLSVPRASALYIGALFGPGLLLLPGLAAQQAGPASIIAWVALLGLSAIFATVFAALGRKVPGAAGAAGYAAAGRGRRADRLPHRCQLRDRADRRRPAGPGRRRGRSAARRARPRARRRPREHDGPAPAGRAADRGGSHRGGRVVARGPPGQLDPVRPARLAVHR